MNRNEIKQWLDERLAEIIPEPSQVQAERHIFMEEILGLSPDEVRLEPDAEYNDVARLTKLEVLLYERLDKRKPVQQLVETGWFYGLRFKVNEHTLIPRPETEHLVEKALDLCKSKGYQSVLDLGTGTGCIAIAMKRALPELTVSAVDLSAEALKVAAENAQILHAEVQLYQGNWLGPVVGQNFDIIVSNPPYIEREKRDTLTPEVLNEPESALFSAWEPPMLYQFLLASIRGRVLNPGGAFVFEVGEGQAEAVCDLATQSGFEAAIMNDYAGIGRIVWGVLR